MAKNVSATREEFWIPEPNLDAFEAKMAALQRKAAKLGVGEVGFEITGVENRKIKHQGSEGFLMPYHRVEVWGDAPVLEGWAFRGKIEHLPGTDDVLIYEVAEGAVPKSFHACKPNCDHCQTSRQRNSTFVVENLVSGEVKQVGGSCLSDFTGGADPKNAAKHAELLWSMRGQIADYADIDEMDFDPEAPRGRSKIFLDPQRVLEYAAAAVRQWGYISRARADEEGGLTTSDMVSMNMLSKGPVPKHSAISITAVDREQAEQTLAWLISDDVGRKAGELTYFHNLRAVAEAGAVSMKALPMFVSAVRAYANDLEERQATELAASSSYVGEQGERMELVVKLLGTSVISGFYGDKTLHRFADEQGNRLVWFNSGNDSLMRPGNTYRVVGRVEKHEPYKDIKQTTLTRVSVPDMALFAAISSGDMKKLKKALKGVFDIDVRDGSSGLTPLYHAVERGEVDMVRALLDAGADLSYRRAGVSVLSAAVITGNLEVVGALVEAGAEIDPPEMEASPFNYLPDGDSEMRKLLAFQAKEVPKGP